MEIVKVILTTLLSVVSLFLVTKFMGHKQVAQLDFFDYVNGITIGSIGAELATNLEKPIRPLIALVIYGGVSILLSLLTHKIPKTRKYINGSPTILFSDGRLYRKNLKKAKLDLSEFMLLCRESGYFDLEEIQVAIFEHNGKLSILPSSEYRPLTPKDMSIKPKTAHIGTELIMDGRIMGENLKRLGLSPEWLKKQLSLKGYDDASDIFLGIYFDSEKKLKLYPIE